MTHDPTRVLMGITRSSDKDVSNFDNDPATFPAGTVVRLKNDGTLSVDAADGGFVGVSLGRSLSDIKKTAVARTGLQIPVLLTDGFTPAIGDKVYIDDATGLADASGAGKTVTDAIFVSGVLTGVNEDNTTTSRVALVDIQGGL